jgi:hypothetical protein
VHRALRDAATFASNPKEFEVEITRSNESTTFAEWTQAPLG